MRSGNTSNNSGRGSGSGSGSGGSNAWRTAAAAPLANYEFDFGNLGRGSGSGKAALNALKQEAPSFSTPGNHQNQQNQQRNQSIHQQQQQQQQPWVHKPAASIGLSGASSMVGDITGKSWTPLESKNAAAAPSGGGISGVVGGVGSSKADLFSDLFRTPVFKPSSSPISMSSAGSVPPPNKGTPMKNLRSVTQDDSFGDFSDFASAPPPSNTKMQSQDDPFPSVSSTHGVRINSASQKVHSFGEFSSFLSATAKKEVPPAPKDPLEDLWRKITPPPQAALSSKKKDETNPSAAAAGDSKLFDGLDEWDAGAETGGGGGTSDGRSKTTTELEGLPPPPAGVSGSMAKDKGVAFQKQGQFADAIKWLTWAIVLLNGDDSSSSSMLELVLSSRVSCYKEVGEYRKAVDDCCKILEMNSGDTEALLQRAFLYESMEKYKLSVEDLRQVLKADPSNRLARNTLVRLIKMVD